MLAAHQNTIEGSLTVSGIPGNFNAQDQVVIEADPSVRFVSPPFVGDGIPVMIDEDARIGYRVNFRNGPVICKRVFVGDRSMIGGAPKSFIGPDSVILEGAKIFTDFRRHDDYADGTADQYAHQFRGDILLGPKIVVPTVAQIPWGARIPTQNSMATIGPMGDSRRFVTITGNAAGEVVCSVACQSGISLEYLKGRVTYETDTEKSSADQYKPWMAVLEAAGDVVRDELASAHAREIIEQMVEIQERMASLS